VVFHSKVGQKDYHSLFSFLSGHGICADNIRSVEGVTNHGVIQVDTQGQTAIIGVSNPEMSYSREELDEIIRGLQESDVLILQNEIGQIPYIVKEARRKGCIIVVNPSPVSDDIPFWPLSDIDYLILNKQEGLHMTGFRNVGEIIESLCSKYPNLHVLLTLGDCGSMYQFEEESFFQPSYKVEAVDTICAGDSFTGFFLASLISGKAVADAMKLAAKAAAIVVGRHGAADTIPTLEEVENHIF
jgi:ribokinase